VADECTNAVMSIDEIEAKPGPGELRAAALHALLAESVDARLLATSQLAGCASVDPSASLTVPEYPGRPVLPPLVLPAQVPQRPVHTSEGRAALLHALAHIEFNAIALALDAVARFVALPAAYYRDWAQVAAEEAQHFTLLRARLRTLGREYGDFAAHDGLWEMARKTAGDVLARMALVPRTLEARGLDASPQVMAKFERAGDTESAAIVAIILRDEIGHVAIGNRWYRHLCAQRGLDERTVWDELVRRYGAPRLRGPFNLVARAQAGFTAAELAALDGDASPAG
jgi:uncharacterized ferritin-like protein (DUF455 family)